MYVSTCISMYLLIYLTYVHRHMLLWTSFFMYNFEAVYTESVFGYPLSPDFHNRICGWSRCPLLLLLAS